MKDHAPIQAQIPSPIPAWTNTMHHGAAPYITTMEHEQALCTMEQHHEPATRTNTIYQSHAQGPYRL